jgi:hypothetical protein
MASAIILIAAIWIFERPNIASGNDDIPSALAGLLLGILGAVCVEWCAPLGRFSKSLPIAFAAFDLSIAPFLGHLAPLTYLFGAAGAAWVLSMKQEATLAAKLAVASGGIVGCDMLGSMQTTPVVHVGVLLALAAVIAALIAAPIGAALTKLDPRLKLAGPIILFALFTGFAHLIFRKLALADSFSIIFLGSGLVALLVAWFTEGPQELSRVVMGAILWLAVASASYVYDFGFGMSIALMAGLGLTLAYNRPKALLCLGPLAAIVIYRVFRQLHPEANAAFDIGQHYSLMGLLLGALTPILAGEWLRSEYAKYKFAWVAAILWILLLAAAPVPVAIAFSDKGIVGYLIGLGLAPVLEATRRRALDTLFVAIGLASAMVIIYNWLAPHLDLDRQHKIHALEWVIGPMAIAAVTIALLSRPRYALEAK